MAKVSMRHLNELQRERNQYSRDALDAWQDFINLKGRMDTELSKVNKRNNHLEQELETWKGQFLKFQAFVDQLNKELAELRGKIESHKRETRRLTGMIDQQKDDAARLALRLTGTERQRDSAMEALVLQQGIAEDLERERNRNKKELAALQHTTQTLGRQRDEAQRVVLHLRALIHGQSHHMDHLVRSLTSAPELSDYLEEGYDDADEDEAEEVEEVENHTEIKDRPVTPTMNKAKALQRVSTPGSIDGEGVTPSMENQLLSGGKRTSKRFSQLSMSDVADRHLRDKTDAIAYIIRSISQQCAAAVESLHLAQEEAEVEGGDEEVFKPAVEGDRTPGHGREDSTATSNLDASEDGHLAVDSRSDNGNGHLTPNSEHSSIPPTPELVHQRSSTALSMASTAPTTVTDRSSLQNQTNRTKIAEPSEAVEKVHGDEEDGSGTVDGNDRPATAKHAPEPVLSATPMTS
jgi:predicted  nucleic acid-binding Zn-ribbon protein